MGPAISKVHSNALATYRKLYYDTNGDVYQGTDNGRLVLIRTGNTENTTTSSSSTSSGSIAPPTINTTNETIIVTEVNDQDMITNLQDINSKLDSVTEDLDLLAMATDRNQNAPLYVEETNQKKDINQALIPSDAPVPFVSSGNALNTVLYRIDSQGYQFLSVQLVGTFTATIALTSSNDGLNWVTVNTYNPLLTGGIGSSVSSAGIYTIPCVGRFMRAVITSYTSGTIQCTCYLRNQPIWYPVTNINNTQLNGTTSVTGGVAGLLGVGGNIAPGSARTSNPVPIAGTDLNNITRTVRSDTVGRLIVAANDPLIPTVGSLPLTAVSDINVSSGTGVLLVKDISSNTSTSTINEVLNQILIELKALNHQIAELPRLLQDTYTGSLDIDDIRNSYAQTIN